MNNKGKEIGPAESRLVTSTLLIRRRPTVNMNAPRMNTIRQRLTDLVVARWGSSDPWFLRFGVKHTNKQLCGEDDGALLVLK